jgi:hypothetical protein
MGTDLFYPPGYPIEQAGPLERFLPPLEDSSVSRVLREMGNPDDLVIDPFGISPRLIVEAAQADRAVLVAVNNPVTRFVAQLRVNPLHRSDLQTALARFSMAPKDGSRLEPFITGLYRTICSRCGASVSANHFVWDRERAEPFLKAYECKQCGHITEEATNEVDRGLARSYAGRGLQFAMALEQLAPVGDPYRRHAEAALNVYPGRALFALITLVSKLSQLELEARLLTPAHALLLYAFDACNALWGYPEGRLRPRRLSLSPQYIENNVWHSMENAVEAWSLEETGVPIVRWPEDGLPVKGTVAIYPGSARFISESLESGLPKTILTTLPRPNQAYWTLSALWAAWLWGREAASPIKVALHRRRYDWTWHARALRAVFSKVVTILEEGARIVTFLPEAEPGFIGAALAGLDGADLRLTGKALRSVEGQSLMQWEVDRTSKTTDIPLNLERDMARSAREVLEAKGEPAPFIVLHAAALSKLAENRQLAPLWQSEGNNPLPILGSKLETALLDRDLFVRVGRATEPERGLYWLAKPQNTAEPMLDRVELAVLKLLREQDQLSLDELFVSICRLFPGLLTPDTRFMMHCLRSYAEEDVGGGIWRLRDEDRLEARGRDRLQVYSLLVEMGRRLGYEVIEDGDLQWRYDPEGTQYRFHVQENATIGKAFLEGDPPMTFVIPGSRASIAMAKARRDPRLAEWLRGGPRILKYRHVRRLAAETTLSRENLFQRLVIDPPDHQDPQLPLL